MKRSAWKLGLFVLPVFVLTPLLLLGLGCGGDDDDNPGGPGDGAVPEAWVGKWYETTTMKDCETQEVVLSFSDTTVICPNEGDYEGINDSIGVQCDYSWSGNQMTVHCTYYDTLTASCLSMMDIQYTATVSGTGYTLTGRMETTYSGEGCEAEDACVDVSGTGTYVGEAPDPCDPFAGGDGGGGDDLAGLSVDITRGGGTIQYETSDQATGVAYSEATQDYIVTSAMTDGGSTYMLSFHIPDSEETEFELSTEDVPGKVRVAFTMMEGSNLYSLVDIQSGSLMLTEFTSESIVGTFSFTGGVQAHSGGDPETYTFANGTMELSVDLGPGKSLQDLMTPRAIHKMIRAAVR